LSHSIIDQRIFNNFLEKLQKLEEIDDEIIVELESLWNNGELSNSEQLDRFLVWLERYNAENQES